MIAINKQTFEQMPGNINNYPDLFYVKYAGIIPSCDKKYMYWNADYSEIMEMSAAEKNAVDLEILTVAKEEKTAELAAAAAEYIETEYPTYKQINAILGIYEPAILEALKLRIANARAEFYTKQAIVDAATDTDTIDAIKYALKSTDTTAEFSE